MHMTVPEHYFDGTAELDRRFKWKLKSWSLYFRWHRWDSQVNPPQREFARNVWLCKLPAKMDSDAKACREGYVSLEWKWQVQLGTRGRKLGGGLLAALLGPIKPTECWARKSLRLQSQTSCPPRMLPLTSLLSPLTPPSPQAHGLFALSGGWSKVVIIFS